jgi:hypothetical protein
MISSMISCPVVLESGVDLSGVEATTGRVEAEEEGEEDVAKETEAAEGT